MEPAKNTISRLISISFRNPTIFFTVTLDAIKEQSLCSLLFQVLPTSNALATFHRIVYWVKRFRLLCFEVNSFSHREAHRSTEKENPISKYLIISVRWVLCQISFESNSCSIRSFKVFKYFQVFAGKNVLLLITIHCNALKLIPQTGVAKGDESNHLYPSHPPMREYLGSLLESEAHKECDYDTNRGSASGVKLTQDSMNKFLKPLPPSTPSLQKKRKKELNFVWWLSTLCVCEEINFDRFCMGIFQFFAVLSMFTSVLFFCCHSLPLKESAPSIIDLDPENATFDTVKILGMKFVEHISFTRTVPSNKKLCIKIFLHLYWYPWPQMKPNWLY